MQGIPENFLTPSRLPGDPPWLDIVPPARLVAVRTAPTPIVRISKRNDGTKVKRTESSKRAFYKVNRPGQKRHGNTAFVQNEWHGPVCFVGSVRIQNVTRMSRGCHRLFSLGRLPPSHQLILPRLLYFKMVHLVTSDNESFTTEKDIVERSVLIKNMLEGLLCCFHLICCGSFLHV